MLRQRVQHLCDVWRPRRPGLLWTNPWCRRERTMAREGPPLPPASPPAAPPRTTMRPARPGPAGNVPPRPVALVRERTPEPGRSLRPPRVRMLSFTTTGRGGDPDAGSGPGRRWRDRCRNWTRRRRRVRCEHPASRRPVPCRAGGDGGRHWHWRRPSGKGGERAWPGSSPTVGARAATGPGGRNRRRRTLWDPGGGKDADGAGEGRA